MTHADKLVEATAWLRSRGRYVLDLRHTSERHRRMVEERIAPAAAPAPPPKADNVRPIRRPSRAR